MQQHTDEALIAYLDGELDSIERRHVDDWLEADPAGRERMAALAQSSDLLRAAYADVVKEPVPERLIAAARGTAATTPQEAEILVLKRPAAAAAAAPFPRWSAGLAAAALFGVIVGGTGTYLGLRTLYPASPDADRQAAAAAANAAWLDNAAGYYKVTVSAGNNMLFDVPASNDPQQDLQKISQNLQQQKLRLPKLEPWGLTFRGARLVVVEGRPAAQLVYGTNNKAIGPLTLVIGASKQGDIAPTFDHRQDVNLLYWRHHGRAYALVGQTDIGWLWGIANDVAWQLDAI